MHSRYDYYDESCVLDEDGLNFPDPLSINYNNGKIEKIPIGIKISSSQITKPWTIVEEYYDKEEDDDILLMEYNVSYINALKPGDDFYIPQGNDLLGFVESALADKKDVNNY